MCRASLFKFFGRIPSVGTYVRFLQCAPIEMANLTRCCCDWMTSELPPMRGKGKGCHAFSPTERSKNRAVVTSVT